MKLLKVSLHTLKSSDSTHRMQISTTASFPEDIQSHNGPLMWPLLRQGKKHTSFVVLLRSILGDGGGMETSEGLYFQLTHRCQSIIWGCLRQEFIGSAGARTGAQVCFSADIITTVSQKEWLWFCKLIETRGL